LRSITKYLIAKHVFYFEASFLRSEQLFLTRNKLFSDFLGGGRLKMKKVLLSNKSHPFFASWGGGLIAEQ
jgi:hypothetical protein